MSKKEEYKYTNSQIAEIIDEYIHNARHRKILKLKFIDGLTYEEIVNDEEIDRTSKQIQRIVYNNEMEIFKHL